jgi:hypothetical protein
MRIYDPFAEGHLGDDLIHPDRCAGRECVLSSRKVLVSNLAGCRNPSVGKKWMLLRGHGQQRTGRQCERGWKLGCSASGADAGGEGHGGGFDHRCIVVECGHMEAVWEGDSLDGPSRD